MSRVVVSPIPPERLPEKSGLVGCSLTLDTDAGTLTWTGDSPKALRQPPTVFPLSGPGAVTTLLVARYLIGGRSRTEFVRLLFLAADGSVLLRGRPYLIGRFADEWPADRFEALRAGGLTVDLIAFGSVGELERDHRGAAPVASWSSPPKVFLPVIVIVALIVAIILLTAG